MKDYIFLIAILILRIPQSFFNKKTSTLVTSTPRYFVYCSYSYVLAGLIAFVLMLSEGLPEFNPYAFGISALGALALALNIYFSLESLKHGVMVLSSLAGSAGLLIPCIAGIFMFAEKMKLMQFAGIALLIFSGWLLIGYSKKQTGAFTFKTLLLLIGSMLSNGTVMLSQKMFSKFLPDMSASVFSFYTFSLLGAGMLAGLIINSFSKANRTEIKTVPRKLFLYGTILSVILFAINQLATVAAKNVPSAVMFPINDGGATIISALTGACFFKEKLTKRSAAGILIGITSLIIINFG